MRRAYPNAAIVIAADNDIEVERRIGRNPGLDAARQAAALVGGKVIVPPDGLNDFSDAWLRGMRV